MQTQSFPCYGDIQGTVLIIGYGSIGQGILPMIKRHFTYKKIVIIDPVEQGPKDPNIQFKKLGLTEDNYVAVLDEIFREQKGFCVNVSVQTSSKDILIYCQSKGILYIDTVVQEWDGFYSNTEIPWGERTNYALRQGLRNKVKQTQYETTAVSCCGANPGMVSWLVKKALINIANDTEFNLKKQPTTQKQWAKLMRDLNIKGIHIAERDTQRTGLKKPAQQFWNTWSVDGFISEGLYQAAELGWGTQEKHMPKGAKTFDYGPKCAIYLNQSGMNTRVKTWCPTLGPQFGFLITHNESVSITDYFTLYEQSAPVYRPTCMYAYHPSDDAVKSVDQCLQSGKVQDVWKIINANDIIDGIDELGVLLYGHDKNAYWFGSQLSIGETKKKIGGQNATALQVTSAMIAGMKWALQNPTKGYVETQQMDYKQCLKIQQTYIGDFTGYYTNWTPLQDRENANSEQNLDMQDPWDFKNILITKNNN